MSTNSPLNISKTIRDECYRGMLNQVPVSSIKIELRALTEAGNIEYAHA